MFRAAEVCLLACVAVLMTMTPSRGGQAAPIAIPWQSGPASLQAAAKANPVQRHVLVQLEQNPSPEQRALLRLQGIELLDYVAGTAWFARKAPLSEKRETPTERLAPNAITSAPSASTVFSIAPEWKLHPTLLEGGCPQHARLPKPSGAPETTKSSDWAAVYILFFRDVHADTEGRKTCARHGAIVRDCVRLINTLVLETPLDAITALAAEDGVQWLEPALPPLSPTNDGCRIGAHVHALHETPYGLDGSGISVMLYDSGVASASHPDFGGRLYVRDDHELGNHSTHVAGTIGGSGVNSAANGGTAYQWRGMAPRVTLQSYAYGSNDTGVLLYNNPGDLEADYTDAILNHGADIANNSLGSNVASNGFDCGITGDYGITSSLIDAIVRGAIGQPFRSIWAVGNERSTLRCGILYATIAPPAAAKNHITVGAVNSDDDTMTSFSGWGPTDDGRLKPDICAPGDERNGDLGVTSTSSSSAYYVTQGTSMACPVVTGICALLLEDFRARFPGRNDPTNAGLKVLLAHTAVDKGNTGPDYKFGFGSVRALTAVEFMRTGNFIEGDVDDAETTLYSVNVSTGETTLKATLAWDDFPATPNVTPALVNDLDLLAISPSGVPHFPWTLDPNAPEAAATRDAPDRVNNIEQIIVDNPEPGTWQLHVLAYSVPQGPQSFTLAASPSLYQCAGLGSVAFSAGAYSCSSNASIVLTDCQLDLHPSNADPATVRVFSTSDPAGQSLTLTETGPSTATFTGSVPLDTLAGPGLVRVADGDTLTVEYADADGGDGLPATVTAEVPVDCVPPAIASPLVANTASTATVQFQIDELTRGVVHYGTTCGAWTHQQAEYRYLSDHTIRITGLTPETDYFFSVAATDRAGNTSTEDNGGTCFAFTTGIRPDFFTELFDEDDVDVSNGTLTFTPNASVSGYSAEFTPGVSTFPTDPTGGTLLALDDDDSAEAILTGGKQVQLYETAFTHFWIASNGYVNLESADTIQVPALTHHFSAKRVSAFFQDLDPSSTSGGGTISWKQLDDHVAVTWQSVPEWDKPSRLNSFQIRMAFDGTIAITWLALGSPNGVAGLSRGQGLSPDFLESDLSAYEKQELTLNPIGGQEATEGETLSFAVSAHSPVRMPTLTAYNIPAAATFVDNGDGTGAFTWQTVLGDAGSYAEIRFVADDGATTREETITIVILERNLPPTALNPALLPASPSTFSTLVVSYQYQDPESDPEGPSEIRWFRNANPIPALNDARGVAPSLTAIGDTWHFTVRPNDGRQFGDLVSSPATVIRNTMDLDADGRVDAMDIQRVINAALHLTATTNEDVNEDGSVNAVDLQLVVNAALGLFE